MTILTKLERQALRSVLFRAKDDWLTYRDSGHGPGDLGGQKEWDAYVVEENANIAIAERVIKQLCSSERQISKHEMATILAALRLFQERVEAHGFGSVEDMDHFDGIAPLAPEEVESLIQWLNVAGGRAPYCRACGAVDGSPHQDDGAVTSIRLGANLTDGKPVNLCRHCREGFELIREEQLCSRAQGEEAK